jgi:hypothetical protein
MNNLATAYLPTFSPVNESERLSAISSSNVNSLAIDGEAMACATGGTGLGQHQTYATPTGATASPLGGTVVGAVNGADYVCIAGPSTAPPSGMANVIVGTTGGSWQKVQLFTSGTLTAF